MVGDMAMCSCLNREEKSNSYLMDNQGCSLCLRSCVMEVTCRIN